MIGSIKHYPYIIIINLIMHILLYKQQQQKSYYNNNKIYILKYNIIFYIIYLSKVFYIDTYIHTLHIYKLLIKDIKLSIKLVINSC